MTDEFKRYLSEAHRILITSHTSPDPDAVASLLLLGTTLELNLPGKQVRMVLEEEPDGLDFLADYRKIKFRTLGEAAEEFKPDFIILVDSNNYGRVSRHDGPKLHRYISQNGVKTAIVDHHEPEDKDRTDIYINSGNPAAVQEIYELCFEELGMKKPEGYAQTTMLGLYSDSGGFAYVNSRHQQTLKLAGELITAGADIERIKNRLNRYSEDQITVLGELMTNLTHNDDYSYTFLNDNFVSQWLTAGKSIPAMHAARKKFIDEYIRNIAGRQWGFVISLDPQEGDNCYSVSLRAVAGVKDVAAIARKLDGGGHKPAAGGKVKAANLDEAIVQVKAAITQTA